MNSPRQQSRQLIPEEIEIQRSLKNWAGRQLPPRGGRERLLGAARAASRPRQPHWLAFLASLSSPYAQAAPRMSYGELSRWMFSQAMIQTFNVNQPVLRVVS